MLKLLQKSLSGGLLALVLTACGSSSTDSELVSDFSFAGVKSGTLNTSIYSQVDVLNPNLPANLSTDSISTSGSATLNGILEIEAASSDSPDGKGSETFAGNLTMLLDFESGNISVGADGFATVSEASGRLLSPVEGQLTGDGKVASTGSEVGLNFEVSGNLEGSNEYTFINLEGSGHLYNTPEGNLFGVGEIAGNGTLTGEIKAEVSGGFLAISP